MLDSAVRAFLLALELMLTSMEPSAEAGGGGVRLKNANVCVDAMATPEGAMVTPEPHPNPVPPSGNATNDRRWLIRAAVTANGVKVLGLNAGHVDVRIFR